MTKILHSVMLHVARRVCTAAAVRCHARSGLTARQIENGKVKAYRAKVKVSFKYEGK
jgi:flavin-binding protein dodecin